MEAVGHYPDTHRTFSVASVQFLHVPHLCDEDTVSLQTPLFCSVNFIVSPGTAPVRDVPAFVAFLCDKITVLGKAIKETPRSLYLYHGAIYV
jgi:hypothetical protein